MTDERKPDTGGDNPARDLFAEGITRDAKQAEEYAIDKNRFYGILADVEEGIESYIQGTTRNPEVFESLFRTLVRAAENVWATSEKGGGVAVPDDVVTRMHDLHKRLASAGRTIE